MNSSWAANGASYRFVDSEIQTGFVNGVPSNKDVWRATGELLRGGEALGNLELTSDATHKRAWLVLPNQRVELERWLRR